MSTPRPRPALPCGGPAPGPTVPRPAARLGAALAGAAALLCAAVQAAPGDTGQAAGAPPPAPSAALEARVREQALDWTRAQAGREGAGGPLRVEVSVGALDARMRLAPCARIEPYLPPGARPWGRSRVGVRCVEGPVRWNVFLPMTVRVWGRGPVAGAALPAGHVLAASDLRDGEVELSAQGAPVPAADAAALAGRTLAHPLAAGQALHAAHLRPRQFFASGDTVRLLVQGEGFAASGEGRALQPGWEDRPVRVRTASGRIVTGRATAERTVRVRM